MKRIQTGILPCLILLGIGLPLVLAAGCSREPGPLAPDSSAEPATVDQAGTLTIRLNDDSTSALKSLVVYDDILLVLNGIAAHRATGDSLDGWYEMQFEPTEYSFRDLCSGVGALVTDATLPTGIYNQLRLLPGEGNRVVIGGEEFDLSIPAGLKSGIKLRYVFEIFAGEDYTATLEFDADRSVTQAGNGTYILRPVLRAIECIAAGAVTGFVNPANAAAKVWATCDGETIECFADLLTGQFILAGLPAGNHTVNFTPAPGTWYPSVAIMGVEVAAGETTDVGVVSLMVPMN